MRASSGCSPLPHRSPFWHTTLSHRSSAVDFPAPLSPCFHPHSGCSSRRSALLVFSIKAAISVPNCRFQSPGSTFCRDLAVTPTRAFAYFAEFQSFPKTLPYARLSWSLCLPLPPSGCTAGRIFPVTHKWCSNTASFRATATAASSSASCCLLPTRPHLRQPPAFRSLSCSLPRMQCRPVQQPSH